MPSPSPIAGRLIGFVATTDVERSKEFYVNLLGFELVEDSPYSLVLAVSGSMIRVQKVTALEAPAYTVLGWDVSDIAETAQLLAKTGIELLRVDGLDQDELGIWNTPGGDRVAWMRDPEGQIISLTQFAKG